MSLCNLQLTVFYILHSTASSLCRPRIPYILLRAPCELKSQLPLVIKCVTSKFSLEYFSYEQQLTVYLLKIIWV